MTTELPDTAVDKARNEIVRVGTSLFNRGYVHASAGNISARVGDGHLITPTDAALGFLDRHRLALVDANGERIAGDRASKTLTLHRRVYAADPTARFVIHTHSTHLVALWIAPIMISWGLVSAAFMFVTDKATFYVLRFLPGAAEAGFYPGVILYCTEKAVVERAVADDTAHQTVRSRVRNAFREPRVWLMCLIDFCFVMGQNALTFWMPSFVESTGIEGNFAIGVLSAVPFLATLVAMNVFGRSADRRRERRWHLVIPSLMGAVGFSPAAVRNRSTALSLTALSVAAAGVLTCAPLFWSLPTAFLGDTAAAAGLAIINSVGDLAGFVSPYMIGAIKDATGSASIPMHVLAFTLVAGAAAVLTTNKHVVNR
ncbi:MFS transporter [Streptomyces malaysiensis subsp. malaysiensis]|uniref:MFS transporter n=1 Tax=Streptomyces malaysiensis TaxID=92644 RepID=UPI0024BF1675|nr:MFS transporter [Streptomyces sp. NA07423]WHX23296.1 MFS transporter [Streptomyces sp. NA07423]